MSMSTTNTSFVEYEADNPDFVQFEVDLDKPHEFYRDFVMNRKKDFLNLDSTKVKDQVLKSIIDKLCQEQSLSESLTILNDIPETLMFSLIIEEFRQNPDSSNIEQFTKHIPILMNE
jgi:hypothetical protein